MFRLISLLIRLVDWAVLLYCVLSWVMPQSSLYETLAHYVDPVLDPVRRFLWKNIPAVRRLPVDISPLVLWFGLNLLSRIL